MSILCNDDNQAFLEPLSTFEGLVEIFFESDASSQDRGFNISYELVQKYFVSHTLFEIKTFTW